MTGIDPGAVGMELHLGRLVRENAPTKARRLLVEARVMVRRVDERGVDARVRGDSGALRHVIFDPFAESWSCDCEARGKCSHILAVAAVVVVPALEEAGP